MTDATDTAAYRRVPDVVWRSGPGRVLIQRIGGPPETAAVDLVGDVAFIWLALDTPASAAEIRERLADADLDESRVDADVRYLLDHALIHPVAGGAPTDTAAST